jgi:hypothetical protein
MFERTFKKFKLYFCKSDRRLKVNEERGKKTHIWILRKDDDKGFGHILGIVKWYGAWRQYWFEPEEKTGWSSNCLKFVTEFLDKVNRDHRKKLRK